MPVVHLVRRCDVLATQWAPHGVHIRAFRATSDSELVGGLAQTVIAGPEGPQPTTSGLLAELASRPGRTVEAWIAIATVTNVLQPLGLALFVAGNGASGVRHSISWLIVHPEARQRGIGRALAERACRRASQLAPPEVWVECHTRWQSAIAFWRAIGFGARES